MRKQAGVFMESVACWALSRVGLGTGVRLREGLARKPWAAPEGRAVAGCRIFAPARISPEAGAEVLAFARFADALAQEFRKYRGHVIIGAAGIAVRALATLLRHKSDDPPVIVLDAAGKYAVSLLSGHWGGGNALARHVADLLGGEAVITTASDSMPDSPPALDELARAAGLSILDWERLPRVAAALLEGEPVPLSDPAGCLPEAGAPRFLRGACRAREDIPLVRIHWQRIAPDPDVLRLAAPLLFAGVGCRKGVAATDILAAVREVFTGHELEPAALAALATVTDKAAEPGILDAAARLGVPLRAFPAEHLAGMPVPHPSEAAGARFGLPAFSVCEGAALMAAQAARGNAVLLVPKTVYEGRVTVAIAVCQGEHQ